MRAELALYLEDIYQAAHDSDRRCNVHKCAVNKALLTEMLNNPRVSVSNADVNDIIHACLIARDTPNNDPHYSERFVYLVALLNKLGIDVE